MDTEIVIIGKHKKMKAVFDSIVRVSKSDVPILITGETGTGKELVAKAIHLRSSRNRDAFVKVNCAAIPDNLLESELFGHEKGAFTDAKQKKVGKFEVAHCGTIFLDEIADMSPLAQAKILTAVETMEFDRIGGLKSTKVNARIISATNRDIQKMAKEGTFRLDLFHRLNGIHIHLPALRARKSDIELLAYYFIAQFNMKYGRQVLTITPNTLERLIHHRWEGNVRELRNTVERSFLFSDNGQLEDVSITEEVTNDELEEAIRVLLAQPHIEKDKNVLETVEKWLLKYALKKGNGVQKTAADMLGISRRVICYKLQKLGVSHQDTAA